MLFTILFSLLLVLSPEAIQGTTRVPRTTHGSHRPVETTHGNRPTGHWRPQTTEGDVTHRPYETTHGNHETHPWTTPRPEVSTEDGSHPPADTTLGSHAPPHWTTHEPEGTTGGWQPESTQESWTTKRPEYSTEHGTHRPAETTHDNHETYPWTTPRPESSTEHGSNPPVEPEGTTGGWRPESTTEEPIDGTYPPAGTTQESHPPPSWQPESTTENEYYPPASSEGSHPSYRPPEGTKPPGPVLCNFIIAGDQGTLESPKYPEHYDPKLHCVMTVSASDSPHVLLFKDFDVEGTAGCMADSVTVEVDGVERGPFCGSYYEKVIKFNASLILTFKTDYGRSGRGFLAQFMPEDEYVPGTETTSEYPVPGGSDQSTPYPGGTEWPAESSTTEEDFHGSTAASESWRPESTTEEPIDGTYPPAETTQESHPPPSWQPEGTTENEYYPPGSSDGSHPSYRPPEGTKFPGPVLCNFIIAGEQGTLKSPKYPEHYDPNLHCEMKVSAANSPHVLVFRDFDVEATAGCMADGVTVEVDAVEHGPFCGSYYEKVIKFNASLVLTFKTDYGKSGRGFFAQFMPEDEYVPGTETTSEYPVPGGSDQSTPYPGGTEWPAESSTTEEDFHGSTATSGSPILCSTIIGGLKGTIESPGYPQRYKNHLNCTWRIEAMAEENLLIFEDFDVEPSEQCKFDAVNVFVEGKQHGPFCGICYEKKIHFNKTATVTFTTDSNVSGRGFLAYFLPLADYRPQLPPAHGATNSPAYSSSYAPEYQPESTVY